MLRWLIRLPFVLLAYILAFLLAPILPVFAVELYGPINNGSAFGVEPRLPHWLNWFNTLDNSLLGDQSWKASHPKGNYWNRVCWLWRNPAYGFLWSDLIAYIPPASGVTYTTTGDPSIHARDNAKAGWYHIEGSDGSFEHTRITRLFCFDYCLKTRFGWILGDIQPGQPCLYLVSIRFMGFRPPPA